MKKIILAIAAASTLLVGAAYADNNNAPLSFSSPQQGVAYYQKDFAYAMNKGDSARALADTYLLQKFTSELYMQHPENLPNS